MTSWIMFECARTSIVIFVLLKCWFLKASYLRKSFCNRLKRRCESIFFNENITKIEFIIRILIRIIKSNNLVATTNLIAKNRNSLKKIVIIARENFQTLMNVIYQVKQEAFRKRVATSTKKKNEIVSFVVST